ncbi:MAG: DUF1566 domain-containing protein [Steroidobacteraceae bacterium]
MSNLTRLVLLTLLLAGEAVAQQVCNPAVTQGTPTFRFEFMSTETVLDLQTGLMWLRCPLGFAVDDRGTRDDYSDDLCSASPGPQFFDWTGALQAGAALNTSGGAGSYTDWRVPNIKELVTIVDRKCLRPAQNLAVFPEVRIATAWTSTTYEKLREAAYVDFEYGDNDQGQKTALRLVRMVRSWVGPR